MAAPISTTYSPKAREEITDHVLEQIAEGRALTRILREDTGMPNVSTFFKWMVDDPLLAEQVERAREVGAATILDEIIDIADNANADAYVEVNQQGTHVAKIDGEAIQRSKLRVYAREKYAQMIAPRRYGPKVDVTSGGEKLEAPTQITDNRVQSILAIAAKRKEDQDAQLKRIMDE